MENMNLPPTNNCLVLPAVLRAQAVQELHELQRISAFVDSRLENNNSDSGEVLNEFIEYENVGMLRREKAINNFDGDDLTFKLLAPSGGGLILYQAYGNLYATTGRKAHLVEDKQIPSVEHLDGIWRKYTLLGLIWRRNGQDYDSTPFILKNYAYKAWRRRRDYEATASWIWRRRTSANTKFAKPLILGIPPLQPFRNQSVVRLPTVSIRTTKITNTRSIPKIGEAIDLTKPGTSHSVPKTQESKVAKNANVIALGMFRINPFKNPREDNFVPNKQVKASVRTKPITVLQLHVITKKDVNSNLNGLSSTRVESTAKTRRPQPRSNIKNDRVPSTSKSSCIKNKEVKVEEHHRNLLLSKNKKHMSSECNNIKLAIRSDKYEVVCVMCKQCLITTNHDVCVLNYVNGMNSCVNNQSANVSNIANQKKHRAKVKKSKKSGSKERLASPRPIQPRTCLRWSPIGRTFDLNGKLIISNDSECYRNLLMVRRLRMLQAHDRESESAH
ncbi:hypothetical protein Tco_1546477 [Tanacetum coccineum]